MIKILYLILNYKTYTDTIKVAKELLQTDRTDFKILIVDNASPNESYTELSRTFSGNPLVDVIASPVNGGYAKGNNFGLRYAKKYNPEYACIMNNDVHFSWDTMDALSEKYKILERPALIAPVQKLPDNSIPSFPDHSIPTLSYDLGMYTHFFKPKRHVYKTNTKWNNVQKVGFIPGALLFTNYSVFEKLGYFDESTFLFCEERFTGRTVYEAGLNNYVITDLFYVHEHSKTISSETSRKNQRKMIHKGRLLYHKKYSNHPLLSKMLLEAAFYLHEFEITLLSLVNK